MKTLISYFCCLQLIVNTEAKTIVFAISGMRPDYLNDSNMVGFHAVMNKGIHSSNVVPVYPALLYPNLYSLVTGLYPESHGFVGDYMYDQGTNEFFEPEPFKVQNEKRWWGSAEPLWITAERKGYKTALYWWPGCEVQINEAHASACESYRGDMDPKNMEVHMNERVSDVLEMFKSNDLHLAMFYYGLVADKALLFGPKSKEAMKSLHAIDEVLQKLHDRIKEKKLENEVNIIIVSDSGVSAIESETYLSLQKFSTNIKYQISFGTMSMILPIEGMNEKLYSDLKSESMSGLHVYQKDEIPMPLHISKSNQTLPILLQADQGYLISPLSAPDKVKGFNFLKNKGIQGYDPFNVSDMKTIFCAKGPAFRKGMIWSSLSNIDVYNVLSYTIGIEPLANNGSWENVRKMFPEAPITRPTSGQSTLCCNGIVFIFTFITLFCILL